MQTVLHPAQVAHPAAFQVADLILLRGWAEYHGLSMEVDLRHCLDGANECDEVIVLAQRHSSLHWMLWPTTDGIKLQPMLGRARHCPTMATALEAIRPAEAEQLTDIQPGRW